MTRPGRVTMAHGAGGSASRRLLVEVVLPALGLDPAAPQLDAAVLAWPGAAGPMAITTDVHVVRPLVFPGGSIGSLAVHGTVNDLAAVGARATAMAVALVLEEDLDLDVLERELLAMAAAADASGVALVAGDTKVVETGRADGMYVTTTAVGEVRVTTPLTPTRMVPGDRILLTGPLADHGTAVLLAREDLGIVADVRSDTRPVWPLAEALIDEVGDALRCLRDPTRGGLATALNELVLDAGVGAELDEAAVPVRPATRGACELLGLDPLVVANEGCLVAVVDPRRADAALAALRSVPGGEGAVDVGEVVPGPPVRVEARTTLGGRRVVDMMSGDPLPRIC